MIGAWIYVFIYIYIHVHLRHTRGSGYADRHGDQGVDIYIHICVYVCIFAFSPRGLGLRIGGSAWGSGYICIYLFIYLFLFHQWHHSLRIGGKAWWVEAWIVFCSHKAPCVKDKRVSRGIGVWIFFICIYIYSCGITHGPWC